MRKENARGRKEHGIADDAYYVSHSNFSSCNFLVSCMVSLKLAEVALFSDELCVVVFAVEFALMCDIVRRAYCATAMGAFEAGFVVRSSIHTHLHQEFVAQFRRFLNLGIVRSKPILVLF